MRRGRPRHDDILTPREWQVLDLLREGLTNEQIADRLGIAYDTAKFHVSEIITKLGVENRQQAAAWRGKPKVAFGLGPLAGLMRKLASVGPWKLGAGGAIAAGVAGLALLALGVVLTGDNTSMGKIAFVRDGNVWVQSLPNGAPKQLTTTGDVERPAWSPDGEWLLFTRQDEDADAPPGLALWLVREDGSDLRQLSPNGFSAYTGYWRPDEDERVIYLDATGNLLAEDADGSNQETISQPFIDDGDSVTRFPFGPSPDGSRLLLMETRTPQISVGSRPPDQTIVIGVASRDGLGFRELARGGVALDHQIFPLAWAPNGQHVLVVDWAVDADEELVDGAPLSALDVDTGEMLPLGIKVGLSLPHSEDVSRSDDGCGRRAADVVRQAHRPRGA